jgi:hypothetical protein
MADAPIRLRHVSYATTGVRMTSISRLGQGASMSFSARMVRKEKAEDASGAGARTDLERGDTAGARNVPTSTRSVIRANTSRISRRVRLPPVLRDIFAGAEPHPIVLAGVLKKLDQTHGLGRPADQTVVQGHGHDLGNFQSFLVQKIKAIRD